jgi:hypothetical protein
MWLDASDPASVILSGGSVSQWNDKSGNGVNATLGVGPNYANRGIVFDGSTQYLRTTLNATSVATSQFLVFRYTYPGSPMVLMGANGLNALLFQFNGATTISTGDWSTAGYSNTDLVSGSLNILAQTSNTTSVNGNTPASGALAINAGGATFTIGAGYTDNRQKFNGTIYEIISYNSVLSTSQRQQVEGYLAWKWGGQGNLPTGHPYKLIAPNTAGLGYPVNLRIPVPVQAFQSGGAIGFDPTSVGTCRLWLNGSDSSSVVLSNGVVTQWTDRSGNNNSFTIQSGGPTYSSNSILFNRSNSDVLISASNITFATTTSYIFYVAQTSNFGNILVDAVAFPSSSVSIRYANGVLNGTAASGGDANDFGNGNYYVNGTFNPGFTSSTYLANHLVSAVDSTLNGSYRVTLSDTFLSRYFGGRFYEVLIYTGGLTTAQRQQIEGYLAWKWGLQSLLPSTHPYRNINPGFTIVVPLPTSRALQQSVFSPKNISGIGLWLDGTDIAGNGSTLVNGSLINSWVDKSGLSNNATQSLPSQMPTFLSSSNAVRFVGTSSNVMQFPTGTVPYSNNPYTIYFTMTIQSSATSDGVLLYSGVNSTNNANGFYYFSGSNVNNYWIFVDIVANSVYSVGNRVLLGFTYTQNVNRSIYANGSLVASTPSSNHAGTNSNNYLGAEVVRGYYSTVDMNEVIIYNSSLTTQQRQSVEGYLAWKWGLVGNLPTNHPFKKFPPPPN